MPWRTGNMLIYSETFPKRIVDALVRGSSRISERLRFHPYVLVVFRASILPDPGVKEQTSIYPKREVNVADVILD